MAGALDHHAPTKYRHPLTAARGTTAQPSDATETTHPNDPIQHLMPDSDEERVTEIRVEDRESRPQLVRLEVGGVPLDGVVDTSTKVTLIGAEAFQRITTVAELRRRDFKRPDKTPLSH